MRTAVFPCLLLSAALAVHGAPLLAAEFAGVEIEDRVSIEGLQRPLVLSGGSVVNRSFLPFHVVALHVPSSLNSVSELMEGLAPFRIELAWLAHHLDAERTRQFWDQGFASSVSDQEVLRRLQGRIGQLNKMLGEVERGTRWVLEYHPDAGLVVHVDGERRGQIAGVEFVRALAGVWVGESASPQVRGDLLTRLKVDPAAQH